MATPTTVVTQDDQRVLSIARGTPDPSFHRWLLSHISQLKGGFLLGITVLVTIYNASVSLRLGTSTRLERVQLLYGLYGTQALIILLIVGFIAFGGRPRLFPERNPRGSAAVEQFWTWWPNLWVAWLLLYGALTGAGLLGVDLSDPRSTVLFHLINNVATLVLMRCYHILAQPTFMSDLPAEGDILPPPSTGAVVATPQGTAKRRGDGQVGAERARFMFWVCLFLLAVGIEAAIAWSPVMGPNALSGLPVREIVFVFGLLYGILAAVATALLIGQLDSPLLGAPPYAIVILFFYAAIQPTFDVILAVTGQESTIRLVAVGVIVSIALLGKLCLFAIVQWLALSNRLFYFMVQNFTLYDRVASHRSAFIDTRLSSG